MPFRRHVIDRIPANARGGEGFWHRSKCLYIGKAKDQPIKNRFKQHWNYSHNVELRRWIKAFDQHIQICYLPVDNAKINKMEKRLIQALLPETNQTNRRKENVWRYCNNER